MILNGDAKNITEFAYHLTYDELEHLRGLSEEIEDAIDAVRHEELSDLLGGSSEGHYHLTSGELAQLRDINKTVDDALDRVRHEDLPDLLGGSSEGHYHLTLDELEALHDVPEDISEAIDSVRHEKLPDAVNNVGIGIFRHVVEVLQRVGHIQIVAVQNAKILAVRLAHKAVGRGEFGQIIDVAQEPYFFRLNQRSKLFPNKIKRAVRRTIVDNDNLKILERLIEDAVDAFLNVMLAIVHRNQHGNFRGAHQITFVNKCVG